MDIRIWGRETEKEWGKGSRKWKGKRGDKRGKQEIVKRKGNERKGNGMEKNRLVSMVRHREKIKRAGMSRGYLQGKEVKKETR